MTDHNWRDLIGNMEPKRKARVDAKVKKELRNMRTKEWWLEVPDWNRFECLIIALQFIIGGVILGWCIKTIWGN